MSQIDNGWSACDVTCLNGVMKVPEMLEVRPGLYDTTTKYYKDILLWESVYRLGIMAPDGSYSDIDFKFGGSVINMEFAGEDDKFVYKVSVKESLKNHIGIYTACLVRWGVQGGTQSDGDRLILNSGSSKFEITLLGMTDNSIQVNNAVNPGIYANLSQPLYIRCNNCMTVVEMEAYLNNKRKAVSENSTKSGGYLDDSCEAVFKGIMWNTHYDMIHRRRCTAISRQWCSASGSTYGIFGSYFIPVWDTFFISLLSGIQDKKMAYMQFDNILHGIRENGMVPSAAESSDTDDRSQPPVGAYCALKLYRQFGEKEFLNKIFDRLLAWNRWWPANRDGNGDGLLEWGSDPFPEGKEILFMAHDMQAAKYESGLDNSPMYDDVAFNTDSNTMELTDIGLNSLYAMDVWALSQIAGILGKVQEADILSKEYERIKAEVNKQLWDEETGIYLNKNWDGSFSRRLSPTCFYPMIAGIASDKQAGRMVQEHLLNPDEFWGEYVIPSISRDDKSFGDNDYWRGRVWGPMNFLVNEGLKRYGFHDEAYDFAKKSLELFMKEWKEKSHIHENYNSVTGEGCDSKGSDPIYFWGGLLPYTAISEIIEARPWDGIRFGNLNGEKADVTGFPIYSDKYSVFIDNGMMVERNGKVILKSSRPAMVLSFTLSYEDGTMRFRVECAENTSISVYPPEGITKVVIECKNGVMAFDVQNEEIRLEI